MAPAPRSWYVVISRSESARIDLRILNGALRRQAAVAFAQRHRAAGQQTRTPIRGPTSTWTSMASSIPSGKR